MPDTFSVRLPEDLRQEVDRLAENQQRSRAFIIKEAVEAYVAEQHAYERAVAEGLSEADKGVFISGEKALAWLEQPDSVAPVPTADIFRK